MQNGRAGINTHKDPRAGLQTAGPFFHLISHGSVRAAAAQEQARLFTEGAALEGVDLAACIISPHVAARRRNHY